MDNVMSKFTLKFKDKQVELHYQTQSVQKLLKPLYYALLIMTLLTNIVQVILRVVSVQTVPLINVGFIILTLINLVIIFKKEKLTQIAMTIENMYLLLLQINFTQATTSQEYFLYGSTFSSLQTGIYFVTNFQYSCPSVILHMIFKFSITTYVSKEFDLILFILSFIIAAFVISVLYICNKAQRLQFLMTVKDNTITKQLETFINKPFSKIKYIDEKLVLDISVTKSVEKIIGFQKDLCFGCNIRQFLRNCLFNGETLEKGILTNQIPLNQSFFVSYQKCKVRIRVCQFNIDESLILIQENVSNYHSQMKQIPSHLKQLLLFQFKMSKRAIENQQFKFGVMSLLMMNNMQIKTTNVTKLLNKLISINKLDGKVMIKGFCPRCIKIKTFCYQFKIFLIQIFNIFSEMEVKGHHLEAIELTIFDICLMMKLQVTSTTSFFPLYDSNFFIQQTSQLLLQAPLSMNLELQFSKMIPFRKDVN